MACLLMATSLSTMQHLIDSLVEASTSGSLSTLVFSLLGKEGPAICGTETEEAQVSATD